ncbi:MAG: type I restriction-modification system subunit M N-terminal domain-containing protein, partial [Burkholderiaceae bacterium]|nr:type I restriction-modification system subunit M N-terminal domain-containing protein [Burkholderiaceae bacterium]
VYVRGKYRDVILPFTVLRRLDAVLEPTKQKVLERKRFLDKNKVAEQDGALRIYGSGIASSSAESVFALQDPSPNRLRFDLERVMRTRYRIDDFQETYFVIRDMDELLELARIDFGPIYERVKGQSEFEPGEVLPSDRVITRGTGAYHAARRKEQ